MVIIIGSSTGPEVKHKKCSKLEESMKLGTKMHLGIEKSKCLGTMRKSVKTISGGGTFCFCPVTACHEKTVKFLHFEFIKWVTQMKRKQFELLHNALGVIATRMLKIASTMETVQPNLGVQFLFVDKSSLLMNL